MHTTKRKMKIDAYMPFYGNDFFAATDGFSEIAIVGYMRAVWHYWHHTHCEGIPNDDDYMRRICRCEMQNWSRVKGLLFSGSPFFYLDGEKWHQARASLEYAESSKTYAERVRLAANARKNNPKNSALTDTRTDTSSDTSTSINLQSESESESEKEQDKDSHTRAESACGVPDVPEVVTKPLPKPKTAAQFTIDQRYEWLKGEIFAFYKRPQTHRIDAYEESLLAEVSRRPDCKEEWRTIQAYRNTLKPSDRRYFPQSAVRLAEKWQDVLDRARNYEKPRTEMSITDKELERITRQFSGGAM